MAGHRAEMGRSRMTCLRTPAARVVPVGRSQAAPDQTGAAGQEETPIQRSR